MRKTAYTTDSERKVEILEKVTHLFASGSYQGLSMRALSQEVGTASSVLYYYFPNKKALLSEMYDHNNKVLGTLRATLPPTKTPRQRLEQIIEFQLSQAERVVAILKYYFAYRDTFLEQGSVTLPPKATLHIEEVLKYGIKTGEYAPTALKDAKIITHIINGYLLEFYPFEPKGSLRRQVVSEVAAFIERSIALKK